MKKLCTLVVTTVMTAMSIFAIGCGPKVKGKDELDNYEVNLQLDKNVSADLKVMIPVGDYEEKIMDSLILGFKDMYPNVNVIKSTVQIGDAYQSTIMTQWQAGILPDVIWTDSTTGFYYLVSKKIALNLNPYIEASETSGAFNIDTDFYRNIFNMCSNDGKLYMVPRSHDNVVVLINKEEFQAAGIDYSQYANGWTWEQFKRVCGQFRTYYNSLGKPNYYPLTPSFYWAPVYGSMLESYNASVFNGNEIAIDSAATREVLTELKEMQSSGYVASTAADGASENSFYSGNQAMIFTSEPLSRNSNSGVLNGKVDVLPYPLMDAHSNPKIGSGSAGYAINADTKVRDVAWAFMNYMLTAEGQQGMAVAGAKTTPIRRDLADYSVAKWGEGFRDCNLGAYLYGEDYLMTPTFFLGFPIDKSTKITDAVSQMFVNALNPAKDIETCIANCVEDLRYAIR